MELERAQEAFVSLLGQIKVENKLNFLQWVCSEYTPVISSHEGGGQGNGVIEEEAEVPDLLDQIAQDLRAAVPPTAIAPGEQQIFQPSTEKEGMDASNTLHVDSFLYPTEEDIDSLCERLEISRQFCLNCRAWKTAPLNFISHSLSKDQVQYIFQSLVPDLHGKAVVDIGSRLGPVLYGAHIYSRASKIVGIECSKFFCDLQKQVIKRYHLGTRVEVICSDLRQQGAILQSADAIVINNPFEFFCSLEEQASIWEFLFHNVRKRGSVLITTPSIQESCSQLTFQNSLSLDQWVTEVSTGVDPMLDEDLGSLHLYCVL